MKINYLQETPRKLKEFPVENELNLSEQEVTDVAEIFSTPLTLIIGITQFKTTELRNFMNLEKNLTGM